MAYLIGQMLLCLLLAALLGFLVGWFWRRWICDQKIAELESTIASLKAKPAAAAPVAAAAAVAKEEDELTRIEGIGPKIEQLLKSKGIMTWAALAATPADGLRERLAEGGKRFRLADPTSWPDQAKLAAEGRWKELDELQNILIAGRSIPGLTDPVGDDLKVIEGIGPKIELLLKRQGVATWAALAESSVEKIQGILAQGGERFSLADPTSWPDQAKLAAESRWRELDEFQDVLLGGRDS